MQSDEIKKGIIKYVDYRRASKFVFLELMVMVGILTWYAVEKLNWAGVSTFILFFFLLAFISSTPLYKLLSIILSIAWGLIGFFLGFLVGLDTIGRTFSSGSLALIFQFIFGIFGFCIAAIGSYRTRERS